ncbi:hypothetical protein PoB_003152300 [Plakobranchus ocellatus]|uniref:Uncharacterized protein n=1 Tax=Plakobranchus ocellatus TaxID=259542 RepID=A0AAV4ACL5_9GAST|nr:hypothetical protein PoB_003152300 [Plakobranchus ocellatus]
MRRGAISLLPAVLSPLIMEPSTPTHTRRSSRLSSHSKRPKAESSESQMGGVATDMETLSFPYWPSIRGLHLQRNGSLQILGQVWYPLRHRYLWQKKEEFFQKTKLHILAVANGTLCPVLSYPFFFLSSPQMSALSPAASSSFDEFESILPE